MQSGSAIGSASSGSQVLADLIGWAGILVPIVLVFVTALIRSIVKSNRFFSGENLYLGIDLCFAGLAASLVETLDLIREHLILADESQFSRVLTGLALSFGSGIALLVVTKLHQTWDVPAPKVNGSSRVKAGRAQREIDQNHRRSRRIWLGIASNGIGFATIAVFAWLRARKLV